MYLYTVLWNGLNSNGKVFGASWFNGLSGLSFCLSILKSTGLEKLEFQRLKKSLQYLESKQRELKRQQENDTRSIESIIKYLKKDMIYQFQLMDYDPLIKHEIKNTELFITHVKYIIESNLSTSVVE